MKDSAVKNSSRRSFLCAAPLTAASLALADFASSAAAQSAAPAPAAFALFDAQSLQDDIKALQAAPGNNNLIGTKEFAVVLTTETAKSAQEFEWHENRDHILQILDGATVYELGGRPKDGRATLPGEWLAPAAEGAVTLPLKKGDMLVIPRGTPHKRRTAGSVTFLLISPMGNAKP